MSTLFILTAQAMTMQCLRCSSRALHAAMVDAQTVQL